MDIPYEVAGKEQFAVVAGSADGLAPAVCAVEPDVYNYLMFSMGYAVAPVAQHVLHQPLPELTEVDEEVEAPKQKIATNPRGRRPFAKRRRGMAEEMARRLQEQLRSATSAASGSSGGFEKIFRKYDKDRSGNLTADEFRRLIRLELRIRPERLSDKDIDALVEALDDDGSGTLGTEEIIDFIKRGSATFFAGSAEDLGAGNEQDVVDEESTLAENLPSDFTLPECASTDLQSSRALSFDSFTANADVVSYAEAHPEAYEYDNFGVLHESSSLGSLHGDPVAVGTAPLGYVAYVAPELHQALVQLSGIPQTAATIWPEHMKQEQEVDVKPERKKKRYLSVDLARRLQQMLKIASYSQSLGRVLKKHDKDHRLRQTSPFDHSPLSLSGHISMASQAEVRLCVVFAGLLLSLWFPVAVGQDEDVALYISADGGAEMYPKGQESDMSDQPDESGETQGMFSFFDQNSDGYIYPDEMEMEFMFHMMDVNRDGRITLAEFGVRSSAIQAASQHIPQQAR